MRFRHSRGCFAHSTTGNRKKIWKNLINCSLKLAFGGRHKQPVIAINLGRSFHAEERYGK